MEQRYGLVFGYFTVAELLALANNVTNEMRNPIRTLKTAGPTALGIVFFLYFFANGVERPYIPSFAC